VTLELGVIAMVLALGLGIPIGTFAALHHNSAADYATMALAVVGIADSFLRRAAVSRPVVWHLLHWLPVAGWEPGSIRHLVLPVIALALPPLAYSRADPRQHAGVAAQPLHPHRLRQGSAAAHGDQAACPAAGLAAGGGLPRARCRLHHDRLTGGRDHRGLPGIGRYLVQGALNRDYTLVMGMVIIYSTLLIVMGLVVDLLVRLAGPAREVRPLRALIDACAPIQARRHVRDRHHRPVDAGI
jgi:oligopeptide transport system permease protein